MRASIGSMSGKFSYGDDSLSSSSVGGRVKESDAPSRRALANDAPNTKPLPPQNGEELTSSSARQNNAASSSHSTARWYIDEKKNVNLRRLVKQVKNGNFAVPIAPHILLANATKNNMQQTLRAYQEFDSLLNDKTGAKNAPRLHLYNSVKQMLGGSAPPKTFWWSRQECDYDNEYFGAEEKIPNQFWGDIVAPNAQKLSDAEVICESLALKLDPFFVEQTAKLINKGSAERSEAFDELNHAIWNGNYPSKKEDVLKNPQKFIAESYNAISLALGCVGTHISILNRQIRQRGDPLTNEDRQQIQMTDTAYRSTCRVMDGLYRIVPGNESASKMSDAEGRMVVVSNRVADLSKPQAGGLAIALGDVLNNTPALWFGSSGKPSGKPRGEPGSNSIKTQLFGKTTLATVKLNWQQYKEYYDGYANSVLWPIFHGLVGLAETSNPEYFESYMEVNKIFAAQLAPLLKDDDVLWIHDYHLIPLAQELRALGCSQRMGFFNHIPMPSPDAFKEIPQHRQLMEALFSNDIIGMQTAKDVENLRLYVEQEGVGKRLDSPLVQAFGRKASVKHFPIGIDVEKIEKILESAPGPKRNGRTILKKIVEKFLGRTPNPALNEQTILKQIHDESGKRKLILGIDRLDYTKGIPLRLEAFRKLLTDHPELRGTVTFVQIAAPSRTDVPAYSELSRKTNELVNEINEEFKTETWKPVLYFNKPVSNKSLPKLYRQSQVGMVTPVADGMNLVAKEYIAAQDQKNPGVLVLSTGAGAASQLSEALLVPPNDCPATAEACERAVNMPLEERQERYNSLIDNVRKNGVRGWQKDFTKYLLGPLPEVPKKQ